jgi:hypothetical protein
MPGMAPEFMMMLQAFQQQSAEAAMAAKQWFRQQQADDTKRHEDTQRAQPEALVAFQRLSQQTFKTLTDKVAQLSLQPQESACPSTIKLPSFDLEKDRATFKQWRCRWNMHICAHKIHLIEDDEEWRERCHTELVCAISNDTLK